MATMMFIAPSRRWKQMMRWFIFMFAVISLLQSAGYIFSNAIDGYVMINLAALVVTTAASLYVYNQNGEWVKMRYRYYLGFMLVSGAGLVLFMIQEIPSLRVAYNVIHAIWHCSGGAGLMILLRAPGYTARGWLFSKIRGQSSHAAIV